MDRTRTFGLLVAGYLFFGIGLIGVFLPILPTTIFWIVAALLFAKSSPQMSERLRNWPGFGPAISDFLDHGVISSKGKKFALAGMAASAVIILVLSFEPLTRILALIGIGTGAIYVITRPGGNQA